MAGQSGGGVVAFGDEITEREYANAPPLTMDEINPALIKTHSAAQQQQQQARKSTVKPSDVDGIPLSEEKGADPAGSALIIPPQTNGSVMSNASTTGASALSAPPPPPPLTANSGGDDIAGTGAGARGWAHIQAKTKSMATFSHALAMMGSSSDEDDDEEEEGGDEDDDEEEEGGDEGAGATTFNAGINTSSHALLMDYHVGSSSEDEDEE
jgi:hypothetical protein